MNHVSIRTDVALAPMTTYKVGGSARWFAEPKDLEELRSILEVVPEGVTIVVLGRGSNVVVSDTGIDGLVLHLSGAFSAVDTTASDRIVAGGAVALPKLARLAAKEGRKGLGFYVGIPGSVGGAVRMNAGGHGSETSDVLETAVVVNLTTGELSKWDNASLSFGYRTCSLTDKDLVVQATFSVSHREPGLLESELREIVRWRRENQPGGTLNAGSVFKNPLVRSAGEIIDDLGLKGLTHGGASVSSKHANFVELQRDAAANDIYLLVSDVQKKVFEMTGVNLEPEIRFLGEFEPEDHS